LRTRRNSGKGADVGKKGAPGAKELEYSIRIKEGSGKEQTQSDHAITPYKRCRIAFIVKVPRKFEKALYPKKGQRIRTTTGVSPRELSITERQDPHDQGWYGWGGPNQGLTSKGSRSAPEAEN